MAGKLYGLTEQDLAAFRQMVHDYRNKRHGVSRVGIGGQVTDSPAPAADHYIARTPAAGIPALLQLPGTSPDEPGSAFCQVYTLQERSPTDHRIYPIDNLTKKVFNLSTRRIPGNAWVLIRKLKAGHWIVTPKADEAITDDDTGTGTGTGDSPSDSPGGGNCNLAAVLPDDCLLATGPENAVILRPGGSGVWTSSEPLTYFGGTKSGTVEFWLQGGSFHLSVGGLELTDCGNGCFTGGPTTGHFRAGSGTDSTTPPCRGEVFTVCAKCVCCPAEGFLEEGWYCVNVAGGVGTSDAVCEPLYLTPADACRDGDMPAPFICAGPYASYAEAFAACGGTGTGSDDDGEPTGTAVIDT
jgi:hypothetical protein